MDTLALSAFAVKNIAECILELVANSLNAHATAIAIRIHAGERRIQVIDNGIGIHKEKLKIIAKYRNLNSYNCRNTQDIYNLKGQTLLNIRKLSDAMLITSRHCNSSKTYMKIFKVYQDPKIVKIQRRPSHGTTVSVYGFYELSLNKWNISLVHHLIANVAMVNEQVSFSIRDDQERQVTMIITKPHNPLHIFKLIYNKIVMLRNTWYIENMEELDIKFSGYIGLANTRSSSIQYVFLNNKNIHCPLILEVTSATFINTFRYFAKINYKEILTKTVFISIFITCTDYTFTMENGKKSLILPSIQKLLQNIRKEILNIFTKNIAPLSKNVSIHVNKHKNLIYSYANILSNSNLSKDTLTPLLTHSHKSHRLCTMYNIRRTIRRKTISEIDKAVLGTENVTKLKSCDQLEIDNFNTKKELFENRDSKTQLVASEAATVLSLKSILQNNDINKETNTVTLSEWSDWSYSENKPYNLRKMQTISAINHFHNNSMKVYKRFDFLPKNLHKQLRSNIKLIKTDILNDLCENNFSKKLKFGLQNTLLHQEIDVRPCKVVRRWREFRLKKEFLRSIKILGQMNNQLIVGLMRLQEVKVLLLMDQHAIHERIRYENLLHKYKYQTRNYLLSKKLKNPIAIDLPVDKCSLLILNKTTFNKFGISFNVINSNTVLVYTVPECLKKNKLKSNVETLLNEILQNFITYGYYRTNNLPFTIHNAIAMEACHGAIKFGDPLTLKECKWLLKLLIKTKVPTRCAHGRPSIVPLLELTELENQRKRVTQVC